MRCVLAIAACLLGLCRAAEPDLFPSDAAKLSLAETQVFLEKICRGKAEAAGCSACPGQTGFANSAEGWQLRAIFFGHFLNRASDDAFVSGFGCEDHATGLGGAFLFTREAGSWRIARYRGGYAVDDCRKLRAIDGRDVLVCKGEDMHQGLHDTFLYLLDPGREPAHPENGLDIFFGVDDTAPNCVAMEDGAVWAGRIESVSFEAAGQPQEVRIIVIARVGKAMVPKKVLDACMVSGDRAPVVATVQRRYEFVFDGKKTVAAPGNPPTQYNDAIPPTTSWRPAK